MRTMNAEKLLKTLPIIQNQHDALLDFDVSTWGSVLSNSLSFWSKLYYFIKYSFIFLLLSTQANPNELTNGVINAAFMLLFKDSIRLFAAYNEGIINLLGRWHFFFLAFVLSCKLLSKIKNRQLLTSKLFNVIVNSKTHLNRNWHMLKYVLLPEDYD